MTTMMLDNPLVDFSRADFSSFAVPSPVRAAVTDSYIEENRRSTPQSAINQRRTERLTVSELNDMDMDEIVKRAYMVPIDTRGPVTRFLDLIDLPRNALFNLAAGDTARRKQGMGDTAALGLPRVNTSDVLESLGVRPGLVTGIVGFVGDVALDPLTYVGPAGWGVRLTGAGGKAVSMTNKGGKILKNTVKEIETGARISDDTVRRYLESTGLTDDVIAKGDRKVIAKEVSDILGQGERTTFNKFMRIFGEAKELGEIPGKNTIADDITSFIAPDADDLTKARITAAQDFYKTHGRPFTPGIRVVKDPASKLGYSFTTSKNVPKGSGVFHVPFTQYDFSIPGFTPAAIQQTQLANLVNDAVATGEYFSSEGMVRVTDLSEQLKESLNRYKARVETADQPPKRSITEIAGTTTPMSEPAGVDVAQTLSPMEVRAEAIKDLRRETKEILTVMSDTIKRIEADPAAKYADLLYARSQFEVMSNQAKVADADAAMLFRQLEEGRKYRTSIDTDVAKRVTDSMNALSAERAEREALVGERKRRFGETVKAIETESVEANVESARYNPATPIEKDENIVGNLPRGLTKAQVFNSEKMLSGHADPALDLDLYNSNAELNESWWKYRTSDPTTPEGEQALGNLVFKDEPVYDEAKIAELPDLSQLEFVTDDQQRLYDEALKAAQIGTRRVEMQPGQGLDFVADKDSKALSNLQESLWVEGKVKTQVDRIDVNKLQVGDTFKFGKANASQANPLTIEVIKIDDDGRVYVKAKMPQPREKARKWYERAKKTEPVKAVPDRYYILKPDAVNIYASRGVDGNPTVLRKVVTEAPQKLTNNIDELASNNEFVQRVDDIARGNKVRNTIESRFAEGEFARTKQNLSKASGLENKRQAIKDINEEQAGELLKSLGTTPEDDLARQAIYEKFQGLRPAAPAPAPVAVPAPAPAAIPNYDRMSAAELKVAAKQAGVDTRTGRAEMIRDLKRKAAEAATPAAAAPTPKPAATPTPITVGPEKVKSSLPPMTAEKRDDLIRQLNQRMVNRVEAISKLIYGMTREQVPSIDLDQIIDVVSEIVFSQADPSKITPEYVIRNVRLKLFDEATPGQFRYESFGREVPTKQRASELAMSRLGLTADDFRRPQFGEGTVYEGMSPEEIRETIAAQERNEMLKTIRFKKHPEVESNFNEEMSNLRVDQINRFVQVDEANKEIERRVKEATAKIARDGKKAAKDRMNEADNAWREVQRRKFAEGRSVAETDAYFDKLKSDIYNKADDDIATIEQQTKIALQNVEQDVSQTVLKERGLTEADMDTRLGKGTEYEGLTEQQIEAKVLRKHEDAYEAKYAEEIAQDKNKAVPKYYSEEELADMEAEVMHLHAMADAAARVANSSTKPLLAAAGSKVTAAVNAAREALGLGADDLGSGILASVATMTEPWAAKGQYGQAAYEMMRGLERTFVTRMGLAPGIANDMVKQFVRAQDISQTQSFRMTIADIQNTLLKSGIPKENWEQASRLAMALMFVGNTPIEQMKALASRDVAFREVLEAIQGGLLDPAVNPNGAAAIQALADKYRKILDNLDTGSGIKNYVPNVLTPQAQNFINFQRNNQALLLSGTPSTGGVGAGDIGVPAEQFLERFQKPRSTLEHRYVDPATGTERTFLESEVAYLDYSEDYLNALENQSSLESLSGTVSGKDMAAYIRAKQNNVKRWMELSEVERQTAETYYLSPHEINRRVKEDDMFDNLTNRALNGNDFMYADVLRAVAQRLGSEERKIARDTLQKYLAPYELLIDQIPLNVSGTAGGKKPPEFLTTNGTKVQIVNEGGDNVIYVGNIKYRRPKAILSPEFSLGSLFMVGGKPITASYYPEQIADIIDDAAGFFGKPRGGSGAARAFGEQSSVEDNFARLLKGADKITGYWKITTLLHPSWTVNDVVGNLFLMANMGISPEKAARNAMQTLKFILAVGRGDTEALSKMQIAGRNGVEHLTGPLSQVIDTAGNVEVSRQLRTTGEFVDPYTFSVLQSIKKLAKGDINGAKQEFVGAVQESIEASKDVVADRIATKPGVTTAGAKARVGADFAFNQMLVRRVWQPWAHLNGISNNWLKATAYFSLLDEGYEATQAARLVSEKMLDMSVLTSTDRAARRLFPFYNWMKNSGVLGVREFLRNPKYFTIAPKIKQALEESFNGEENLPENARPSWIRDQLAFQVGTDPDTRRALTLTSSLPTEAATYAISFLASPFLGAGALQDSLAYVTNALTPVIKVPAELGARKEFFTKRTISSEGGDITPTEYAIGQVRPLRELGIGSLRGGPLIRAFQDDPVLGISRGLIGGRLQPFDEERRVQNLQREYDERVDALRRRIGIAERENQKEESIRRRIDLLKVFNQMEGLGLTVPKWASRQVEQIKTAQETM